MTGSAGRRADCLTAASRERLACLDITGHDRVSGAGRYVGVRDGRFRSVSFDVAAEAYDRFMGRYSLLLSPQLADLAGVRDGQRVLDVGCGPGRSDG